MIVAAISKMIAPLQRRVALMVSRAQVLRVDDSTKIQVMQVGLMKGVVRDGVERFQQYGFTSVPYSDAESVVVSVGGNQDHAIVINVDDRRYRLVGLADGEAALYDDLGQKIHLTRNGIVIDGAGLPVKIQNTPQVIATTPQFTIDGALHVTQAITTDASVAAAQDVSAMLGAISLSNVKTTYNTHTHLDPQGGSIGAPQQQL